MGKRALEFSRAHPNPSPGYTATVTRLEERLARAERLVVQQREGTLQVRAATARKREIKRALTRGHLLHLATAARIAAEEEPDIVGKFQLSRAGRTYLGFVTVARGMAAEAESRKELLVRHGLVDVVLEGLVQALDQFDAAVASGSAGRQAHVSASAELDAVADEVVRIVDVMDGLNRVRFAGTPEELAAWSSASNLLVGPVRLGKQAAEERPAA
ncbi:MAG TPA: hypothetical protein VEB59_07710 [Gemmatimonadales bacterium]|nr:hypothetical protein [Gemmatimonadales bacterium]